MTLPLESVLLLASVLFALGLLTVLTRRNLLFQLLGVEVMLNAAGLAFVAAGARWSAPDGQVMFLLVLTVAAAEVSVGLALVLLVRRRLGTLDADALVTLAGDAGGPARARRGEPTPESPPEAPR